MTMGNKQSNTDIAEDSLGMSLRSPYLLKGRDPIMRRTQRTVINAARAESGASGPDNQSEQTSSTSNSFSPKRKSTSVRAITQRKPDVVRGATSAVIESFRDLFSL